MDDDPVGPIGGFWPDGQGLNQSWPDNLNQSWPDNRGAWDGFVDEVVDEPPAPVSEQPQPTAVEVPSEQPGADLTAYRPASEFLNTERFTTYKRLHAALKMHGWIRTLKPSKHRLLIHAGDWHQFLAAIEGVGFDALDQNPAVIDEIVRQAAERQRQARDHKAAK
jgi:hypothetical protein